MAVVPRILVLSCFVLLAACAARRADVPVPSMRQDTVTAIKRTQKKLGFEETANFRGEDPKRKAFYRCYYTGKLELPASYDKLDIREGGESGCPVDENEYDLFFYKIEAVASGDVGVSESLEETTIERFAVVVSHEDFHEDPQVQRLPTRIGEAATTLIGFLTAARFARSEYGAESETFRNLDREADLYLRKSRLVNDYYERLSRLYGDVRAKRLSRDEALARKAELYGEMQRGCEAIEPNPTSFNKCLTANNNAGLAFEITYTRYYPLIYELHESLGGDTKLTIVALREAGELGTDSEERTAAAIRRKIEAATANSGGS